MAAKSIDQGRASEYWTTPHEMAARAFQAYVEDKIAEKGGRSYFLTYGTNMAVPTPWGWQRPFPAGEERQAINAAFDKLIDTLETKETDQGTALYSRRARPITGDDTLVSAGLSILARNDEMFQLPVSDAKDMAGIANDIYADAVVQEYGRTQARAFNVSATRAWTLNLKDRYGKTRTAKIIELPSHEIYLDIGDFREGGGGNAIYHIVANYAYNNNLVFIGDPYGLSDAALRRRTENMLATAIKFGTTRHIAPHERQLKGDTDLSIPPLNWEIGDDAHNINALAETAYTSVVRQVPEMANVLYNFETHRFEDAHGNEVGDKRFVELASKSGAREARAGRDTLKRTALINSLVQGKGSEGRSRILGELLRQSREHLDPALKGIFYSRTQARPQGGLSVSAARAEMADALGESSVAAMEQAGILNIIQTHADAPAEVRATLGPGVEAVFQNGRAWLFADEIAPGQVTAKAIHEIGEHYGLETMLGEKGYAGLKTRIRLMKGGTGAVAEAWRSVFQSSPAPRSGRYQAPPFMGFLFGVSILARSEERALL